MEEREANRILALTDILSLREHERELRQELRETEDRLATAYRVLEQTCRHHPDEIRKITESELHSKDTRLNYLPGPSRVCLRCSFIEHGPTYRTLAVSALLEKEIKRISYAELVQLRRIR